MSAFYEAPKAVYGPSHQIQAPLHSSDGSTLLTFSEGHPPAGQSISKATMQRIVQESSLAKIPQAGVNLGLDDPPTREKIKKATMQLKVGKPPGTDGIPAEVYQYGVEVELDQFQDLFTDCW